MTIELPGESFTEQDDMVPMFGGVDSIWNYDVTYTLAGNDLIIGTYSYYDPDIGFIGLLNNSYGTIDTGRGRDTIIGRGPIVNNWYPYSSYGIYNHGTIEMGDAEDTLISYEGFDNSGRVSLGSGNDQLFAELTVETAASVFSSALQNYGTIDAGDGDDYLVTLGTFYNSGTVSLGDGNDRLHPQNIAQGNFNWVLSNSGTIEGGNGDDSLICSGSFYNSGRVFLGNGNDSITTRPFYGDQGGAGLRNSQNIDTGDGDDIILSTGVLYNEGFINTGNGKDSLIAYGDFQGNGYVFLGNGEDYLSSFGSGYYEGGNDEDTLALGSGSYTIGISGTLVSFIKDGYIMRTYGFEKLIAGGQTYNFTSLTDGLTLDV
jgi:hypothetical protein